MSSGNLVGQSLGRYHIVEQLGQGGMAVVYKAYDMRLESDVAVKVLRREAFTPEMLERVMKRFEREAKALARLTHPNLVKVIDFGEHEGIPYLVMPYLAGGTLKQRLGKPWEWREAVRLVLPIARALEFAHSQGILHRDVKPSNILITVSGEPLLSDFGIAKLLEAEEGSTLTGTGVGIGTPEYMAPEQAVSGKEVDGRADVYSLGIVLYEMVTGRKPYTADTPMAVIIKQMSEPLPRPREYAPGLPEGVEKILFKALAKKPAERYGSMAEFAGALERQLQGSAEEQPSVVWGGLPPEERQSRAEEAVTTVERVGEIGEVKAPVAKPGGGEGVPGDLPGKKKVWRWAVGLALVGCLALAGWLAWREIGGGETAAAGTATAEAQWEQVQVTATSHALALAGTATAEAQWEQVQVTATSHALALAGTATAEAQWEQVQVTATSHALALAGTATAEARPTVTPRAVEIRVREIDGMEMVYVPAGAFWMGSEEGEGDSDEHPRHEVYLDGYWIDRYEVTNEQYAAYLNARGNQAEGGVKWLDEGDEDVRIHLVNGRWVAEAGYEKHPVVEVNWYGAAGYCEWAGGRLPTEAEWEKAARGTDGREYPWGEGLDCGKANYGGCVGGTSEVGRYASGASPYGALDMAGNVWEWVADWYGEGYYGGSPRANPPGPSSGGERVVRGGSWDYFGYDVRAANRHRFEPSITGNLLGFRCALSP